MKAILVVFILTGLFACSGHKKSIPENMNSNKFERYTADYIAIRQLIDRYNDIVNHRTWDDIETIFAKDATWEALDPVNLVWKGLDDIRIKLPTSVLRMEVLVQTSSGIIIDVNGDNATARSILSEFGRNKETGQGMHSVGSYQDEIVKENGEWKFKKRTLTLLYNDALPVPGKLKEYKY